MISETGSIPGVRSLAWNVLNIFCVSTIILLQKRSWFCQSSSTSASRMNWFPLLQSMTNRRSYNRSVLGFWQTHSFKLFKMQVLCVGFGRHGGTLLLCYCFVSLDRLDALGAIGIARAFSFGGMKKRPLYFEGESLVVASISHDQYVQASRAKNSTLSHFYEKLFLLKDMMKTKAGKQIAENRHEFMEQFVSEFLQEWKGVQ